jgi:hypothetical protein
VDDLADRRIEWITADQAADEAWEAVTRLPAYKEYRKLRRKADKAKERFRAAWIAQYETNERKN